MDIIGYIALYHYRGRYSEVDGSFCSNREDAVSRVKAERETDIRLHGKVLYEEYVIAAVCLDSHESL